MEGPDNLDRWIERLEQQGLPILTQTDKEVATLSSREESTAAELAHAVLRDPAMTSHVLHMANAAYYNPSQQPISTVSRAVVLLGFDAVLGICVSKALLDSFIKGEAKRQVLKIVATSLHSAVQARAIAQQRGDSHQEDLFIAALLYRLGRIALWSLDAEAAQGVEQHMQQQGRSPGEAEREVFGFSAEELTRRMNHQWQLNPLLSEALDTKGPASAQSQTIVLANRIAEALGEGAEQALPALLKELGKLTGLNPQSVHKLCNDNAEDAAKLLSQFGIPAALIKPGQNTESGAQPRVPEPPPFPEADPGLQIRILGDIATMLQEKTSVSLLLETILEGIHRGIGMDRALLALMSPDGKMLRGKHALGMEHEALIEVFKLPVQGQGFIARILQQGKAVQRSALEQTPLPDEVLLKIAGEADFFIAPIKIKDKNVGVFYADRRPSARPLPAEAFTSFVHIAQQASLGLTLASLNG